MSEIHLPASGDGSRRGYRLGSTCSLLTVGMILGGAPAREF
jgi:hypothetical protein